jgi:hypothetical protein
MAYLSEKLRGRADEGEKGRVELRIFEERDGRQGDWRTRRRKDAPCTTLSLSKGLNFKETSPVPELVEGGE